MDKDISYTKILDDQILRYKRENQFLEFKSNYQDAEKLGRYISALSNGACLAHEDFGYLYFGVNDLTLEISGTTFNLSDENAKGNQSLEIWLRQQITPKINFQIDSFLYNGNIPIVRFKIPAAKGEPTKFSWKSYVRVDSHTTSLEQYADWMRAIYNSQYDWSAEIIVDATIEDLDKDAIAIARIGFKERYPQFSEECDKWSDEVFLDKARLTCDGQITRTTMLLVGKEEKSHKLSHIAQIVWKCFQDGEVFGDIFTIPFVRSTTSLVGRIRNYRFKIYPYNTLIPAEVWKYDQRSILEGLHNCLAHMDFTRNARIIVTERMEGLTFESPGSFFQGEYEEYILGTKTPDIYRNPALMRAMVNIKMIDYQGYGLHNLFLRQMERYLPMPDYDGSNDSKVVLHLPGVVMDENYSFLLISNSSVSLTDAILLDKVQKGQLIPDNCISKLRRKGMIEGRKPNIYVAKQFAQSTGKVIEYSQHKGLEDRACEQLLIQALRDHTTLTRQEIDQLLWKVLSDQLNDTQKKSKVSNILSKMRMDGLIKNRVVGNHSEWSLLNDVN